MLAGITIKEKRWGLLVRCREGGKYRRQLAARISNGHLLLPRRGKQGAAASSATVLRFDRARAVRESPKRLPDACIEDRNFEAKTGGQTTRVLAETIV